MRHAAVCMRAAGSSSPSNQEELSGKEVATERGDSHAAPEPADRTAASAPEEASPVNLLGDDDPAGRDQLRTLLLAAIQEHRFAYSSSCRGGDKREAKAASGYKGEAGESAAVAPCRSSETQPAAGRQLMVHLAQLQGTQLRGLPPPPPPAPGGSGTTATAFRPGGRTTALLAISEWVHLLQGLTSGGVVALEGGSAGGSSDRGIQGGGVVAEAADEASSSSGGGDVQCGDGGAGGTQHPVAEGGEWVSVCEALLEVMQSDTELQFRGGSGSSGRRADDDGRGSPRENDDGRGRGSRREDDDSAAAERLSGLIVAASGLLRILFLARKEEQSRGGSPLESSHSTLKTPRSGIPLLHQQQKDSLLLLQQRRRRSQRRWMQLALSALRPHLFLLQPPMLLRLLRCLATGEGHPVGLPLLPANPAWMQTVYSCTADVHVPPVAATMRIVSSSSDANPGTAGSCTEDIDVQSPPPSSTTVSRCHMGLMNSLQLKRLVWALSKLGRGQSPPDDWKQVGGWGGQGQGRDLGRSHGVMRR